MKQTFLPGDFDHSLDSKGRVTLPARYRSHFEDGVVLVRMPGQNPCLRVYHPDAWIEYDERYLSPLDLSDDNSDDSWKVREIYQNMDRVEPDSSGRVLLPAQQIKELGFLNKVKIVGNRTYLEIWDPSVYQDYAEAAKQRRGNSNV